MSTAIESSPAVASPAAAPFDLTVDMYMRLVDLGLLPRDRPIFLEDGRLYEKTAKTRAHGYVGAQVTMTLVSRLPRGWSLWPESPIELDARNAMLPDFAVLRGSRPLEYAARDRYPGPSDVGILIEIAVTSLRADLSTVIERVARALVPVYWVVDVPGRRILVHSGPRVLEGRASYASVETFGPGQGVPLVLDGQEVGRVPFEDLLG